MILNIVKGPRYFKFNIADAEKHFNAKYIDDFALKDTQGNWTDTPWAVFYQETPPEPHMSHYFGLSINRMGKTVITGAQTVADALLAGVIADNGEIIYSRYRHDYRVSSDNSVFIDGGFDYTKSNVMAPNRSVTLKLEGPELVIVTEL